MAKVLHNEIVCSTVPELINSPAFYGCVVHLVCNSGHASFVYNGNQGTASLFDNPVIHASAEDVERFKSNIANIRNRVGDVEHRFHSEMIGSLLQAMIYDLFDFHVKSNDSVVTTDRVGYITYHFFLLIEADRPKTQREISYYAELLNVNTKYFVDTIKRVKGASVSTHINRAVAAIIKSYLDDNKLSVSQIAEEKQSSSLSYFSRYCVKHIGQSPAQYRTAGMNMNF